MNIFEGLLELPIRRGIQALRNKLARINEKIGYAPAYYDQYPGKAIPWVFSKVYGPIDEIDGTDDNNDQSTFFLPNGTNILTGRDASFYWKETNIFAFSQRNATSLPNKSLFDSERSGGGGTVIQNFQGPQAINNRDDDYSKISLEIDLYDKKRGRSITGGRMPTMCLQGGAFDFRSWENPPRWDPDTEIEPRLYVMDASESGDLATANVVFFVNIVFKGVMVLQEVNGREQLLADDLEHGGRGAA